MVKDPKLRLLELGIYAMRQTKDADVLGLVGKLSPRECGFDLIRVGGMGDGGILASQPVSRE